MENNFLQEKRTKEIIESLFLTLQGAPYTDIKMLSESGYDISQSICRAALKTGFTYVDDSGNPQPFSKLVNVDMMGLILALAFQLGVDTGTEQSENEMGMEMGLDDLT